MSRPQKQFIVPREKVYEMMEQSMRRASTSLPSDVEKAFRLAIEKEQNDLARLSLETVYQNCRIGEKDGIPVCSDTGFPLYYVRLGNEVSIEGGFAALYDEGRKAVENDFDKYYKLLALDDFDFVDVNA